MKKLIEVKRTLADRKFNKVINYTLLILTPVLIALLNNRVQIILGIM